MTITKADLVLLIHQQLGLTKKDIGAIVDTIFDKVRQTLISGESVKLSGFGNFEVKKRGRRVGRNPKTGEEKEIPPRTVVSFKPSQIFKEGMNDK
jgi:integration host factor subunit alpha